jgi:hypothetical protein
MPKLETEINTQNAHGFQHLSVTVSIISLYAYYNQDLLK